MGLSMGGWIRLWVDEHKDRRVGLSVVGGWVNRSGVGSMDRWTGRWVVV